MTVRDHPVGFRDGISQSQGSFPCIPFCHHRHMGAVDLLTGHCPFQGKIQGRRHFLPVGQHLLPVISHVVTQVQSTWEQGTAAPCPAKESVDHTPLFPGRKTAPFHTFRFCKGKISHLSHLIGQIFPAQQETLERTSSNPHCTVFLLVCKR